MEVNEGRPPRVRYANLSPMASLVSSFLLLGSGFFAGWYWQNASVQDVVKLEIIEKGEMPPEPLPMLEESHQEASLVAESEGCQFVGSKNSDKFHSPDSAPARRIKPENKVCFSSESEAMEEGYEAGTIKE